MLILLYKSLVWFVYVRINEYEEIMIYFLMIEWVYFWLVSKYLIIIVKVIVVCLSVVYMGILIFFIDVIVVSFLVDKNIELKFVISYYFIGFKIIVDYCYSKKKKKLIM